MYHKYAQQLLDKDLAFSPITQKLMPAKKKIIRIKKR